LKLLEIYEKYKLPDKGGDKGTQHSYMDVYASVLQPDKDLLEIGVWQGHSLAMFTEFFTGNVVGLDWDLSNNLFGNNAILCDATDPKQIAKALGNSRFDYIIDDGSHLLNHQRASFQHLWPYLRVDGLYFIEDINGSEHFEELKAFVRGFNGIRLYEWDLRHVKNRHDDILLGIQKVE
jgi:hypothetical protein